MSDTVIQQDPELTKAADAFVEEMLAKSDGEFRNMKLWTNWALRFAFERGVAWEQSRQPQPFMQMVPGMRPVNREDLAEYERAMREEVIPELVKQQKDRYWGVHTGTSETPVARLG